MALLLLLKSLFNKESNQKKELKRNNYIVL